MQHIKVTLIHKGAPESMKAAAARVIDGKLLKAVDPAGRVQEAKAVYNRMMGIKNTSNDYECIATDEPPYEAAPLPVSIAGQLEQQKKDAEENKFADRLAEGIAKGVAAALAAQDEARKDAEQREKEERGQQAAQQPASRQQAQPAQGGNGGNRPRL